MAATSMSPLVREARALAQQLLSYDPKRLAHVRSAGMIAEIAADAMNVAQSDEIVAAAWLHDIGYSPAIAATGFHPLDGALHLSREGWPPSIVLMVAHHSHAAVLARYYGVHHHMALLDHVHSRSDDIITFSDLRSGTDGLGADPRERIDDMRRRHADRAFVPTEVREMRYRMLLTAASRVNAVLTRVKAHRQITPRAPAQAS